MTHQYQPQHGGGQQHSRQMSHSGAGMHGQHSGGQQMHGQHTGGQQMGQPMSGQQMHGQGMQGHQGRPQTEISFEDHLTDELRLLLEDFSELSQVAAWCAKECASGPPELGICARVCQDIAEIAELNEMLIARDSMFGPEVADVFIRIANEGLTELQYHQQHHPHVTETIATIERTMNSAETVLQQVGGQQTASQGMTAQMQSQGGGGQQMGQPMSGQRTGSHEMQGMPEQGAHGHGMSGQPTGSAGSAGRQY